MTAAAELRTYAAAINTVADQLDAAPPSQSPPPSSVVNCLGGTAPNPLPTMIAGEQDLNYFHIRSVEIGRQAAGSPSGFRAVLGDSILGGTAIPGPLDWGIAGNTLRGLINQINAPDVLNALQTRCSGVALLIGINDICYEGSWWQTNTEYLFDLLSQQITGNWTILKILPINEAIFTSTTNAKIDTVNRHIQSLFGSRFTVVDLKPQLAPQGQLLTAYSSDGCHINTKAGQDIIRAGLGV